MSKIILYHGSLEQLNSRSPDEQYESAEELSFCSEYTYSSREDDVGELEKEIQNKGFDGIVDLKYKPERTVGHRAFFNVEGTPIVKKRS